MPHLKEVRKTTPSTHRIESETEIPQSLFQMTSKSLWKGLKLLD